MGPCPCGRASRGWPTSPEASRKLLLSITISEAGPAARTMTVADLQDSPLAKLDVKPHPTIAEWDAKAERIETPLSKGRIVWRKWGSGHPLVFFHGGSG